MATKMRATAIPADKDLGFTQISKVMADIASQVTGKEVLAPIDTTQFMSVATTALKCGYDPVIGAISQVVGRTVFSNRPYTRKFRGFSVSEQRWGNVTRKLQMGDSPALDDPSYEIRPGDSIDPWKVQPTPVLQTNFYGFHPYMRAITYYRDQLNSAFRGPDEFAQFMAMKIQNLSDQTEQDHESFARMAIANLIGGVIAKGKETQKVHLITEYNTYTGGNLTAETVRQPENWKPFVQWMYGRIAAVSAFLTERTNIFHQDIAGEPVIMRHTPYERQRVYLLSGIKYQLEKGALADIYHDNYLRLADTETVNFWQNINSPDTINIKTAVMDPATGLETSAEVNQANVFGVIMDEEAAGMVTHNQWSATTPLNAYGGYSNAAYHYTDRYWNDFTENAVVLLMD